MTHGSSLSAHLNIGMCTYSLFLPLPPFSSVFLRICYFSHTLIHKEGDVGNESFSLAFLSPWRYDCPTHKCVTSQECLCVSTLTRVKMENVPPGELANVPQHTTLTCRRLGLFIFERETNQTHLDSREHWTPTDTLVTYTVGLHLRYVVWWGTYSPLFKLRHSQTGSSGKARFPAFAKNTRAPDPAARRPGRKQWKGFGLDLRLWRSPTLLWERGPSSVGRCPGSCRPWPEASGEGEVTRRVRKIGLNVLKSDECWERLHTSSLFFCSMTNSGLKKHYLWWWRHRSKDHYLVRSQKSGAF